MSTDKPSQMSVSVDEPHDRLTRVLEELAALCKPILDRENVALVSILTDASEHRERESFGLFSSFADAGLVLDMLLQGVRAFTGNEAREMLEQRLAEMGFDQTKH